MGESFSLKNYSLEEIKQLVEQGHFVKSKSILNQLKDTETLLLEKITIKILKYRTLVGLHEHQEALKDIDITIEETKQNNMEKELLQILYLKSYALMYLIKFDESISVVVEGLRIVNSLSNKKQQQFRSEKAYLLLQQGYVHFFKGDYKKVLLFVRKALILFEEINSRLGIGTAFLILGITNYAFGNITEALEFLDEALEIVVDLEINHLILESYFFLSRIYYFKGQIYQAQIFLNKLLPFIEKYNDDYRVAVFSLSLVPLLAESGNFDLAKEKALLSLKHIKKTHRDDVKGLIYYRLVQVAIFQNNIIEAKKYLEEIYILKNSFGIEIYLDYIRLAEAQILMKNRNTIDNNKAKLYLIDLIENLSYREENSYEARYYLCNILLQEFLNTSEKEILERLNKLTTEILDYGKKSELIGFRVKANNIRLLTVWVQQQHLPSEAKGKDVEQLLMNVQRIAEKHGLDSVTKQFSEQKKKLLSQKQSLEEFTKEYYIDYKQDSFRL